MNAIENNPYTAVWRSIGQTIEPPRAILSMSAHWYTRGTGITAMANPRTVHDFGGFPQALFDTQYRAPGDPQLAREIADSLTPLKVSLDESWGLDHGTWSVLVHMYPDARIPVLQLSLDATQPALFHFELGTKLRALRERGVMIFGNGNIVHNLQRVQRRPDAPAPDWATRFNDRIRDAVLRGDDATAIDYHSVGDEAMLAVPTPEHYLPLLYVLGAKYPDEKFEVLTDGIELGSISMLSVGAGVAPSITAH